jgi:CubicO group peptidase (beta-lactamase class C family)
MPHKKDLMISGSVTPGFEAVREAFVENFTRRGELGAACCIYYQGEKVVDLWGGVRNRASGEPWEEDTMVLVFSTTKGMSALALALAHSRGWLDYEAHVCDYWPEFAQHGKEKITVRQLLAHQAGLFALDGRVDKDVVAYPDRLAAALAQQKPAWEPGTHQAYHAFSLGFYEGELLRRVDPQHRTLGQFFQDEIATPLGLDFYIRLPEDIPNRRLASIERFNPLLALFQVSSFSFLMASLDRHSPLFRATFVNPGPWLPFDRDHVYTRNLEVPSGGGVGTARSIAKTYSVFATGGHELGLRPETLKELMAPAVPAQHGFYDECMKREMAYSLGFRKPDPHNPFGSPSAFGSPGAGGSFGFADPEAGLAYAYVLNRMGPRQGRDPRDLALRQALRRALRQPIRPGATAREIKSP